MSERDEDLNAVERFGSLTIRFSFMSMRWFVLDGIVIMGQYKHRQDAVRQAKQLSGVNEPEEDLIVPIPPVDTDLSGFSMSPEIAANLQNLSSSPSPVLSGPSSPEPSMSEEPPPSSPPPPPSPSPSPTTGPSPSTTVTPPTTVGSPV